MHFAPCSADQSSSQRALLQEALATLCPAALEDLLCLNEAGFLSKMVDTRDIHRTLYGAHLPQVAGIWRGTKNTPLADMKRSVYISRLRQGLRAEDRCVPPRDVSDKMGRFAELIEEILRNAEGRADPMHDLARVTHAFFAIHPYADGNGHVLRILLCALALRLGIDVKSSWTLHRRPYDETMSFCIQWYHAHPKLLADHLRRWFVPDVSGTGRPIRLNQMNVRAN